MEGYWEPELTKHGFALDWTFSMADADEIDERLKSFYPQGDGSDPVEERLHRLFSMGKESPIDKSIAEPNTSVNINEENRMETLISSVFDSDDEMEEHVDINLQDMSCSIADACQRLAPKSRSDISAVQLESEVFLTDLVKLNETSLTSVMKDVWCQLKSVESGLCFCVMFSQTTSMCSCLCKHMLLPWLRNHHPNYISKLELLSQILCKEGDTVCVVLVAPLLQDKDSPWVKGLPEVEELMSAMTSKQWTLLLKELLSDLKELQEWQIPVLALIVGKAQLSYEELSLLIQLMSSVSSTFDQNRDFGALVAAVAGSLKPDCALLVPQLKTIVNSFKGSLKVMKLKTLKIIAEISESF